MGEPFELDYDAMVFLDAEDLAEGGIGRAYLKLLPALRRYVGEPLDVVEELDGSLPRYAVRCGADLFPISGPDVADDESWGRAAHAFFAIVNRQLERATHRLYALNGGNDLGGLFLTADEAAAACASLESRTDWPYFPTLEGPWYGQPHD